MLELGWFWALCQYSHLFNKLACSLNSFIIFEDHFVTKEQFFRKFCPFILTCSFISGCSFIKQVSNLTKLCYFLGVFHIFKTSTYKIRVSEHCWENTVNFDFKVYFLGFNLSWTKNRDNSTSDLCISGLFCERDSLHVGKMICRDFFWLSEHHLAHFMHRSLVLVHSIWSDTTIGMHGCSEWFLAML